MNAHANIVAAGPAIEGKAKAPAGPQDWEQLVSPGHVVAERIKRVGWMGLPVALVAAWFGITSLSAALSGPGYSLPTPAWIAAPLTGDPSTWTDLGGGVRTDYRLAWLSTLPTGRGLEPSSWTALVQAVSQDVRVHGGNAASWTATAELATGPQITRPSRAFTDHAARFAETGIVAVPENGGAVMVAARVDGALSLAAVNAYQCATVFGPAVEGCSSETATTLFAQVQSLKPQTEQE